jgi:hypothetical protein
MSSTKDAPAGAPIAAAQAAAWLGVKPETLASWRYLGKGPRWFKAGDRVRYFEADLMAFLVEGGKE